MAIAKAASQIARRRLHDLERVVPGEVQGRHDLTTPVAVLYHSYQQAACYKGDAV